jgi:hypothetical protein
MFFKMGPGAAVGWGGPAVGMGRHGGVGPPWGWAAVWGLSCRGDEDFELMASEHVVENLFGIWGQ